MTNPSSPPPATPEQPLAVAAVLLFSDDPDRLARFYRDKLAVPLRRYAVGDITAHYGCDIGRVYLSIWPANLPANEKDGEGETSFRHRGGVALYVRSVQREFDRLEADGVRVDFPPTRTQMGIIARLRDPDGNVVELYQPPPR